MKLGSSDNQSVVRQNISQLKKETPKDSQATADKATSQASPPNKGPDTAQASGNQNTGGQSAGQTVSSQAAGQNTGGQNLNRDTGNRPVSQNTASQPVNRGTGSPPVSRDTGSSTAGSTDSGQRGVSQDTFAPPARQTSVDVLNDLIGQVKSMLGGTPDLSGDSLSADALGIDEEALLKAAGGNQEIVATLLRIAQDPEGREALKSALEQGYSFVVGPLEGNVEGLIEYGKKLITLEDPTDVETAAHELLHAFHGPDYSHDAVNEGGKQIALRLGASPL